MNTQTQSAHPGKATAYTVGFLVVAVLAFGLAKEFGIVDGSIAKRAVGMIFGALLIVTGNFLPKIARPLGAEGRNSARAMAAERFAGWTFVLAGIVYLAVWLFAPQSYVMLISSLVALSAFALVIVAWAWKTRGESPVSQPENLATQKPSPKRALFLILHALFWVFAMFLADSIWGDGVAQWMAVAFVIVNGILVSGSLAKLRARE